MNPNGSEASMSADSTSQDTQQNLNKEGILTEAWGQVSPKQSKERNEIK